MLTAAAVLAALSTQQSTPSPAWATKPLRAGIIGTDTSHVPAFTKAFRDHPEWRIKVVAAYKAGVLQDPKMFTRVWLADIQISRQLGDRPFAVP